MQEAIANVTKDQADLATTNVVNVLKQMSLKIDKLQKKVDQGPATPATASTNGKTYAERKVQEAPICKNCNHKHPGVEEDKCWELEANTANHKPDWKTNKTNSN
jgi:hypothetical protein